MSLSLPFYSGVFLVSACLMALQILQSRIFSVTTWYHLAFLVISIAMFGMTLAALHIHKGNKEEQKKNFAMLIARASRNFGLYIIVALAAQLLIPIVYTSVQGTMITLPLLSFFTVLPYYQAGLVLTLALTRAPFPVPRTYGVDLVGAAVGCLLALALMKLVDAPSAIMVLAALALTASFCFGRRGPGFSKIQTLGLVAGILAVTAVNVAGSRPFIYPLWMKSQLITQDMLVHDEWNAISRITVYKEIKDTAPYLWGPSPLLPEAMKASYYYLEIDGDASTPINYFSGDKKDIESLAYDVTTIAYALPDIDKVGIIGVGGGRDVLTAHYFGAQEITALDVNNIQISLLTEKEPFKSYAGLAELPGLRLINSEARSWFSRSLEKFDLIQMSLIDTWAATGAGAYALSENGLYTTDAWDIFLNRLTPDGVLTVSRWYSPEAENEVQRLLSLAVQSLLDQGVQRPRDHIFMATAGRIATLVLSKSPLSDKDLAALGQRAGQYGFDILIAPGHLKTGKAFNDILAVKTSRELRDLLAGHVLDLSPPGDERPFFFNQVRIGRPLAALKLLNENTGQGFLGQIHATLNLFIILCFALFMVVFVILRPLRTAIMDSDRRFIAAGTSWFLLIGLGFMLLEVALLQRMSIFLGHPVYGLSVILFSLVLSAGVGSLLSERVKLQTKGRRAAWIVSTAVFAVILSFVVEPVFASFTTISLLWRAFVCVALTVPLGLLLGFGFPTGMTLVKAIDERPSAWFWGINGAVGVMGSALAVALNIALGLNTTIILGGLCYALLILPSSRLQPAS